MLNSKMINPQDLGLIYLTDSPRDAVDFIIKTAYEGLDKGKKKTPRERKIQDT